MGVRLRVHARVCGSCDACSRWTACAWLHDEGRSTDRPDRIGVYLTFAGSMHGEIARFHEVRDGALSTSAAIDFIERTGVIARMVAVGITREGNMVLGGPGEALAAYQASLREDENRGFDTGFIRV